MKTNETNADLLRENKELKLLLDEYARNEMEVVRLMMDIEKFIGRINKGLEVLGWEV